MKVGDVLARYKPAEKQVRILLDGSIQSRIDEARQRLKVARRTEKTDGLASKVQVIQDEINQLEAGADEAAVVFKVAAIPGAEFDKLKFSHPPTEAQWERFKQQREATGATGLFLQAPEFDVETLAPDLIGLSIVEVDGESVDWDVDDGRELWAKLHDGARADLFEAAWGVNGQRSTRPLSETATGTTSNSGSGSTTSASKESPTPPSSEES